MKPGSLHVLRAVFTAVLCAVLLTGLSGCTTLMKRHILIDEVIIDNQTGEPVSDVKLWVPNTRIVLSASSIPAGREYSLGFEPRRYLANDIFLYWQQPTGNHSTPGFMIPLPTPGCRGPGKIYIELRPYGRISRSILCP